jgi:hypothetical protein
VLAGLPVVWYGGVHVDPAKVESCSAHSIVPIPPSPSSTSPGARDRPHVVIQITYVIQFLSAFSIFAGVVILASSIAGTRYRRIREVVVMKTLGATRAASPRSSPSSSQSSVSSPASSAFSSQISSLESCFTGSISSITSSGYGHLRLWPARPD